MANGKCTLRKIVAQELTNSKSSDQDPNHVCILCFLNQKIPVK